MRPIKYTPLATKPQLKYNTTESTVLFSSFLVNTLSETKSAQQLKPYYFRVNKNHTQNPNPNTQKPEIEGVKENAHIFGRLVEISGQKVSTKLLRLESA